MNLLRTPFATAALLSVAACGPAKDATDAGGPSGTTVLGLDDLAANTSAYGWTDFRPNLKKLILAGAEDTEHVAILWYTVADGSVGLHYHSKTESVYVIEGTQTDAKGSYPTGTVYFNPPGSGHAISNSTGFFILAYASPPDFANTALIGEYTPVRIDTAAPDLTSVHPFEPKGAAVRAFAPPLDNAGGMSAELVELASSEEGYPYSGNYVLVLDGSCSIDGVTFGERTLVVAQTIEPRAYGLAASGGGTCLAMGVSF